MNSQKKTFESRELRTVSMNQLFGILDDNRQEEAYIFVRSLLEAQEKDEGLKNEEPENEEKRRILTTLLTVRLARQLTIENLERANEYMMALQEQQETGEDQKAAVMTFTEANEVFDRVMSLDDSTREWFINGLIDADLEKREKWEEKKSVNP